MRTFVRLKSKHALFLDKLEDIFKRVCISFRKIHHGNNLIISVLADNMVIVFRETFIIVRAYILDRNLVFHPLSVLRVDMSEPCVFKVGNEFFVIFLGNSVLQKSVRKEPVSVSPHLLPECCILVRREVLPHIAYPADAEVWNQSLRIKHFRKTGSNL